MRAQNGGSHFTRTAEWNGFLSRKNTESERLHATKCFFSFLFLSVQSFIVVYYTLKIVTWSIIQITEHHLLKMYRREREETLMTKASMRADGNWFAVDARQLDLERERPWWCQIKTRDRYLITLLLLLGAKFIGGQPRNAKVALSGFSSGIFQVHACCSENCAVCRA
jgi:ABC-type uncharacterized transport system substrate-binding protein